MQMRKEAARLERSTRRYNALVRERAALAQSGETDLRVGEEIAKLESDVPSLKPDLTATYTPSTAGQSSHPLHESDSSSEADTSTTDSAATPRSSGQPLSSRSSSRTHAHKPRQLPLIIRAPRAFSADAPPRQTEITHTRPAVVHGYFTVMFALQLFDERHKKSLVGPASVVFIALLAAAAALAHCTLVDPSTLTGSLLSPSLLTLLVHANILCGLYIRRKRRMNAPMLIVYTICDVIPSLGLGIVSYNLSLIALELYGFRRASYAC